MKVELGLICSFLTFSWACASPHVDTTGKNGFFYRGTEFTKIFTVQSGTPFMDPGIPSQGWVNYYGSRYDGVMLQYDIEDDQLVSHDITGAIRMQLVKEKISSFGFNGRDFIRLYGSELFFERIYHGLHDVLIRWQKVFTRTGNEEGKYKLYKTIFIWDGKDVVAIQNNQDLFRYFGKSNKQIKDYVRDQRLSVKKDPEKAIVAVVGYADKNRWNE